MILAFGDRPLSLQLGELRQKCIDIDFISPLRVDCICREHIFHIIQSVVDLAFGLVEDKASEVLNRGTLTLSRLLSGLLLKIPVITLEVFDDLLESSLLVDSLSCWQGLDVLQQLVKVCERW